MNAKDFDEIVAARDYSLAAAAGPARGDAGFYFTVVIALAATASGVALFGVGSAFWGLAVGFIALAARRWIRPRA